MPRLLINHPWPALAAVILTTAVLPAVQALENSSPTTPGSLSAHVYSNSAAELFWERSSDDGFVLEYNILRNGALIDTRDALSFFDNSLHTGIDYTYSIVAVDSDGNHSASSNICVRTDGDCQAVDTGNNGAGDTLPAGLHASVYSATAAELFWDRGAAAAVYTVSRDGTTIGTTNGTSFFDDSRTPGIDYTYVVSTTSSSPAGIFVGADGTTKLITDPHEPPVTDPESPSGADLFSNKRVVLYSANAGELFWDRPPAIAGVIDTAVERNGVMLGSTTGTSFFDDTRDPGQVYTYELIAFSMDGLELGQAMVSDPEGGLDGPNNPIPTFLSPIIRQDNFHELLTLVVSVFSGNAYGPTVIALPNYSDSAFAFGSRIDSVAANLSCTNGGTVDIVPFQFGVREVTTGWDFLFDNCLDGDTLISGDLKRRIVSTVSVQSSGLTIDTPDRQVEYSGAIERKFTASRDGGPSRSFRADEVNLLLAEDNRVFELINATTSLETALPFSATMNGSFRFRSALAQKRVLSVEVTEPFDFSWGPDREYRYPNFQSGKLVISAEDGSSITIDASEGGQSDFRFRLWFNGTEVDDSARYYSNWFALKDAFTSFTPILR